MKQPINGSALFLPVLLHYGARGDLLGALAVASGTLGGLFDVFVLALLFRAAPSEMSFDCHKFFDCLSEIKYLPSASDLRPAEFGEQSGASARETVRAKARGLFVRAASPPTPQSPCASGQSPEFAAAIPPLWPEASLPRWLSPAPSSSGAL